MIRRPPRSTRTATLCPYTTLFRSPMIRFPALLAGAAGLALLAAAPASAQLTVHDPTNYSQNLLSAARALQQINNQITSLQNEASMRINPARNLTSLPTSTLSQNQRSMDKSGRASV